MTPVAADETSPTNPVRPSRRAVQAAETRSLVVAAAGRLFAERGWAATGMRDIAGEAGVAIETVYKYFSSKSGLLHQVIDIAVVGDDAPVALAERPEYTAMGTSERAQGIAAAADMMAGIQLRTARFALVLREAAPSDAAIAEMLESTRARQRADVGGGFELLAGRPATDAELDGLWAILSPEVYLLLVDVRGWTLEQYRQWVATMLELLLPPTHDVPTERKNAGRKNGSERKRR